MPVKDWQIDIARTILEIPPDDWGTDTEDAFAGLLTEIGGEGGAASVVPHYASIRGINPPPFTPARTYWVPSPAERLSKLPGPTWYWTENIDVPERIATPALGTRIVTHLTDWEPYTWRYERIVALHRHLRISPMTHRPAQLAWRVFREFLVRTAWPRLPDEAILFCARAWDTYFVQQPIPGSRLPRAYVYDKHFAYGDYLRRFPDLVNGRWVAVDRFTSPLGVYDTHHGYRSGFWLAVSERTDTVVRGWAWDGEWFGSSPFERFVDWCFAYRGPLRSLVRRFPAFVVGKTNSHGYVRKTATVVARPTYYPMIFLNVIGGLQAEMQKVARAEHPHHAFIDSVHLDHPAHILPLGSGIGQWRLVARGPALYAGLNRYRVGPLSKHQGLPNPVDSS